MGFGNSGVSGHGGSVAGTPSGTAIQNKQVFDVIDIAGQTIFTCTTITAIDGSIVIVDGSVIDFGVTRVGQVFTFDVAVGAGSRVTITGANI